MNGEEWLDRTERLIGSEALERLAVARVALFGIGGVGGYALEVLARSGVGAIDLIDGDRVAVTNINRQLIALTSTVGRMKTDVAEERVKDINPRCKVVKYNIFYLPDNADTINLKDYDYVADCIDNITAKAELIRRCTEMNVPIISCMGAAFKMNVTAFRVADLADTKMDPIAKLLRKRLRPLGIEHVKVVYSEEVPLLRQEKNKEGRGTRPIPASNAFVPAAAGLLLGSEVVKDLTTKK